MLVEVEIRGTSPLLMHRMTDDEVLKLLQPKMKKMVAADLERTPSPRHIQAAIGVFAIA